MGELTRRDVVEIAATHGDQMNKIILAFGINISKDAEAELENHPEVRVFSNDVVYRLIEEYQEWLDGTKKQTDADKRAEFPFPAKFKIIPNCIFRASKPAIAELEVVKNVSEKNPLRKFNCLDDDLDVTGEICAFLSGLTDEPLMNIFFKKDAEEVLPWSDFVDLTKKHGVILKRLLSSDHPVNILLYGAPGTGKTSFARTLAKEVGKACFRISQNTDSRGGRVSSGPGFRYAALQVCESQVDPQSSIIVVDEADEMLKGKNMAHRTQCGFAVYGTRDQREYCFGICHTAT